MKHLITNNDGGFPFDLDDYRYMESGFNEDIVSILMAYEYTPQSFGTPPPHSFIIYGCEMTDAGTGFVWTGGAVFIDGIIYRVKPNTTPMMTTVGNAFFFSPTIVNDSAGYESFKNGIAHNTYGERVANVIGAPVASNLLLFYENTPRFLSNVKYVNHNYLPINNHGTGLPDYSTNWTNGNIALGFRKNEIGQVEFKGRVKKTALLSAPIFMLNPDYCPRYVSYFTIPNITANTQVNILVNVLIAPGGTFAYVSLLNEGDVNVDDQLDFTGVRFSTV